MLRFILIPFPNFRSLFELYKDRLLIALSIRLIHLIIVLTVAIFAYLLRLLLSLEIQANCTKS